MANIAVFLPRSIPVETMIIISIVFISGLGYMFFEKGGKIQKIVLSKANVNYVRSATIVDLVYSLILWFFKEYNSIPMSTTWVFVGLLAGRELAFLTTNSLGDKHNMKVVFPMLLKDFFKMMVGLAISVAIVLMIHYYE